MAACITPFYVDNPAYLHSPGQVDRQIPVPCGKCPSCLRRRVSQWSFRLLHELRVHDSAHFITLTYDNDSAQRLVTDNGFLTLNKTDFQAFVKALRKRYPAGHQLKYYMCGEYGDQSFRPHYHAILFGACSDDYDFEWRYGHVHVGSVSEASIAYVLKYINKGKRIPVHSRDDRLPEFALMSKKLGRSYITPALKAYYAMNPLKCYCTLPGGYIVSMPRYYKDLIFDEFDKVRICVDQKHRLAEIQQVAEDEYIREFGSLDGFYSLRDTRRMACIENFKKSLIKRGF